MSVSTIDFPHKCIRSKVIKKYMQDNKYSKAVCFTCGNAAAELRKIGVDVLEIGAKGVLTPCKWFKQSEIKKCFPKHFDATCGHLNMELILALSNAYKDYLGELNYSEYNVKTGSGETLLCLKLAYPNVKFNALYNLDNATEYNEEAPLNKLVELLANKISR